MMSSRGKINIVAFLLASIVLLPAVIYAADVDVGLPSKNGTDSFRVLDSRANSLMNVQSNGRVGIGTTSPGAKLHVGGTAGVDGIRFPDNTLQTTATLVGPKGNKGDTGAQGPQGKKGNKGDTGAQGPQGKKGNKGDTGLQGPQGKKGNKGDTGAQGVQGKKGNKGDTGAQGPQGKKGDKGDSSWTLSGANIFNNNSGNVHIIGNLGIGTTTPGEMLDVNGHAYIHGTSIGRSGGHYDEIGYNVDFTGTNDEYNYRFSDTAASIRLGFNGGIEFRTAPNGTAGNNLTLTNRMVMDENGNVGIGTTGPVQLLHIKGPHSATLRLEDGDGSLDADIVVNDSTIQFRDVNRDETEMMIDLWNNKVGIGTTSPQAKLHVNGGVRIGMDNSAASASKAGTIRYRERPNGSVLEMCMKTGTSSTGYEWVTIKDVFTPQ